MNDREPVTIDQLEPVQGFGLGDLLIVRQADGTERKATLADVKVLLTIQGGEAGPGLVPYLIEITNASGSSVSVPGLETDPAWITVHRNGALLQTSQFRIPNNGRITLGTAVAGSGQPDLQGETIIVNYIN